MNVGYDIDAGIVLAGVRFVDPDGQTCEWPDMSSPFPFREVLAGAESFTVPAAWGGTLYTTFLLFAKRGVELATAKFPLSGTAGCNSFAP